MIVPICMDRSFFVKFALSDPFLVLQDFFCSIPAALPGGFVPGVHRRNEKSDGHMDTCLFKIDVHKTASRTTA